MAWRQAVSTAARAGWRARTVTASSRLTAKSTLMILDDPAGFIGGDTSGIDEAIAEFGRDAERGPDDGPVDS